MVAIEKTKKRFQAEAKEHVRLFDGRSKYLLTIAK
jgi:hypothetical protein